MRADEGAGLERSLRGQAEVLRAASRKKRKGKQGVGLPVGVDVTAVTATTGQFCSRRLRPPGPWSALTPGPGWDSGHGSQSMAEAACRWRRRPGLWTRTRRRTRTRRGKRSRWSRQGVASSGGPGWRNPISLAAQVGRRRQGRGLQIVT